MVRAVTPNVAAAVAVLTVPATSSGATSEKSMMRRARRGGQQQQMSTADAHDWKRDPGSTFENARPPKSSCACEFISTKYKYNSKNAPVIRSTNDPLIADTRLEPRRALGTQISHDRP